MGMKAKLVWQPECPRDQRDADGKCNLPWTTIKYSELNVDGSSVASADVTNTGTFKVIQEPNPGPIIALTVALIAFIGAIAWVLLNKCGDKYPQRQGNGQHHHPSGRRDRYHYHLIIPQPVNNV